MSNFRLDLPVELLIFSWDLTPPSIQLQRFSQHPDVGRRLLPHTDYQGLGSECRQLSVLLAEFEDILAPQGIACFGILQSWVNFSGSLDKGANGLRIVVANEGFPEEKMVYDN